jgi:ATP-dependent DNA ligase
MLHPPVPPMLATPVERLPIGAYGYEPKWDGWRALLFRTADGIYLQSRSGRPLAAYFPEIARLARAALPPGLVLDGELVVWEAGRERTSFTLLQRRIAGTDAVREAYRHPAHLVAFDVLQIGDREVLTEPFARRRDLLVTVLDGAPAQLAACPHTHDPDEARDWLRAWPAAGVEGVVIKALDGTYQPGRRGWQKLRRRHSAEAIIGGVTGTLERPDTVLLGRLDTAGRLRFVGRSKPLTPAQRSALAPLLTPAGRRRSGGVNHPWPRPLPAGWSGSFDVAALDYKQVAPAVVAEVRVDAAYERTRWRHAVDYIRARAEASVHEVPLLLDL